MPHQPMAVLATTVVDVQSVKIKQPLSGLATVPKTAIPAEDVVPSYSAVAADLVLAVAADPVLAVDAN